VLPFFFATTFTLASMYIWSRGAAPDFLPPPAPEAGSRGAAPGGVVGVPPDSLPPPAPEAGSRGAAPGGVAGVPPDSLPPPAPEGGISRRGLLHPLLSLVAQAILLTLLLAYIGAQVYTYVLTDPDATYQSASCPIAPA